MTPLRRAGGGGGGGAPAAAPRGPNTPRGERPRGRGPQTRLEPAEDVVLVAGGLPAARPGPRRPPRGGGGLAHLSPPRGERPPRMLRRFLRRAVHPRREPV